VGIVAPWVVLLLLGRPSRRTLIAILLATVGLGFVTVSGTVYVCTALACAGAWHLLRGRAPARLRGVSRRVLVPALAFLGWAAPTFVYWRLHHVASANALGWVLIGGAAAAMGAAALLALQAPGTATPISQGVRTIPRLAVWAVGLGAGFVVSNNLVGKIADGQVRATLADVLPGYGLPLETRGLTAGVSNLTFPTFTGQECQYTGHCVSFPYFLVAYGFLTVLALATWFALGQRRPGEDPSPRRAAWLVTVAALAVAFALIDFSGADQVTAWVLTRFIEIPYYALLGLAAVALIGSRSRVTAWAGGGVLVAWSVIPVANSHLIPQLVRNAGWLIARITH
jgi:hypothetical protein